MRWAGRRGRLHCRPEGHRPDAARDLLPGAGVSQAWFYKVATGTTRFVFDQSSVTRELRYTPDEWSLRGDWRAIPQTIFICENPTVAEAAADALGVQCPALVCTGGVATMAAVDLVAGLAASGCTIHVRADFDSAGLVIVDQLLSVAPDALSWRYDTKTYLHHASAATSDGVSDLRAAMADVGTTIHEETLLDDLLTDLRTHSTQVHR